VHAADVLTLIRLRYLAMIHMRLSLPLTMLMALFFNNDQRPSNESDCAPHPGDFSSVHKAFETASVVRAIHVAQLVRVLCVDNCVTNG